LNEAGDSLFNEAKGDGFYSIPLPTERFGVSGDGGPLLHLDADLLHLLKVRSVPSMLKVGFGLGHAGRAAGGVTWVVVDQFCLFH
jgi:hypothetical protein